MKTQVLIIIIFFIAITGAYSQKVPNEIIINNVHLIDGNGNEPMLNSIKISNGTIVQIGNFDEFEVTDKTSIIDGTGKYLIPGLIDNYSFFKIADGVGGHTQTLALFAKNNLTAFDEELKAIKQEHTTLHHFALEIEKSDYEEMMILCKKSKIEYVTEIFEWVKWKSIFVKDPESNIVEFVCHDPDI